MRHADSEKLLGYEIRRNGKAIGFTTSDTYTDDLGAANNLTYRYSVVPVDKLGNLGVEASRGSPGTGLSGCTPARAERPPDDPGRTACGYRRQINAGHSKRRRLCRRRLHIDCSMLGPSFCI